MNETITSVTLATRDIGSRTPFYEAIGFEVVQGRRGRFVREVLAGIGYLDLIA